MDSLKAVEEIILLMLEDANINEINIQAKEVKIITHNKLIN